MTRRPLCRVKSLPSVFNNSPSSPTFARAERLAEPHQRSSRAKSAVHSRSHADRDGVASHSRQQSPKAKTGEKSKNNNKEWKASPIHELLPPEVCKQVHQAAPKGGVVIEIQWSSTEYLPEHKGGKKYYEYAERLQELLKERFGDRLPVHVLDKPIRCKRRKCCVSAKGCKNEQLFWTYDSWCLKWFRSQLVVIMLQYYPLHIDIDSSMCKGPIKCTSLVWCPWLWNYPHIFAWTRLLPCLTKVDSMTLSLIGKGISLWYIPIVPMLRQLPVELVLLRFTSLGNIGIPTFVQGSYL